MREAPFIHSVIVLLEEIYSTRKAADRICTSFFRANHFIGSHDRRHMSDFVYDVLRHHARLHWVINQTNVFPKDQLERVRLLVLTYLSIIKNQSFERIKNHFGQQFGPAMLSAPEIKLLEILARHKWAEKLMKGPEYVRFEVPEWVYQLLSLEYPHVLKELLSSFSEQAFLDLRVNTIKADKEDIYRRLAEQKIPVNLTPYSPWGLRIKNKISITASTEFQKGEVEIQDEGSQIIALLTQVKPGMRVLDFCAGAGGKTLALAGMMQNKGFILALDIHEDRLERARKRLTRAGVHNAKCQLLPKDTDQWMKRHIENFDLVLIDAPCSGSGTWRRNPEARWRVEESQLKDLSVIQEKLLTDAAQLVKKGGQIVYSTCSLFSLENEAVVNKFLQKSPSFKLYKMTDWLHRHHLISLMPLTQKNEGYLKLLPFTHHTDGFFGAILEKKAE